MLFIAILARTVRPVLTPSCQPLEFDGLTYQLQWLQAAPDYYLNRTLPDQSVQDLYLNFCVNVSLFCTTLNASGLFLEESQVLTRDGAGQCLAHRLNQTLPVDPSNYSTGVSQIYLAGESIINVTILCNLTGDGVPLWTPEAVVIQSERGCPSSALSFISNMVWNQNLLVGILLFLTGAVFLLFGVLLYQATLFLFGVWTAWMVYGVLIDVAAANEQVSVLFWVCFACSILTGVLTLTFPYLGRVLIGVWVGVLLAMLLQNMFMYLISSSIVPLVVIASVLGVLFAVLCVLFRKYLIIISTSFIGAYMMIRPISWYLGNFPNETQVGLQVLSGASSGIPFKFWFYVLEIALLVINGYQFQTWLYRRWKPQAHLEDQLERKEQDLNQKKINQLFVAGDQDQDHDQQEWSEHDSSYPRFK